MGPHPHVSVFSTLGVSDQRLMGGKAAVVCAAECGDHSDVGQDMLMGCVLARAEHWQFVQGHQGQGAGYGGELKMSCGQGC